MVLRQDYPTRRDGKAHLSLSNFHCLEGDEWLNGYVKGEGLGFICEPS